MREGQDFGGTAVRVATPARIILVSAAALTVAADQITKSVAVGVLEGREPIRLIGDFLRLNVIRNPGGAFGVVRGATFLLFLVTSVIIVAVSVWAWRSQERPLLLGLVIGGGLGNIADRIVRGPASFQGHVVDFIDFSFWPTFNLADSAITVGVALLLLREVTSKGR